MTWWVPVVALAAALMAGSALIPWLRRLKYGQTIREVGPARHLTKQGTPTMGGIIFVVPAAVIAVAADPGQLATWALALLLLAYAAVGFADDYVKVVKKQSLGLKAREKLVAQVLVAGAFSWVAAHYLGAMGPWQLPFGGQIVLAPGWYYPLSLLAILGTANATNLADGVDGLLGGTSVISLAFFTLYSVNAGHMPAALFSLVLAAGVVGFLRYNLHPAKLFMGDTGSLALGGALAGLAIVDRATLILPLVGGVFVLEALSVIIQVFSFRVFKRRVFKMSPLHHHFELVGWSEERIVLTFWAAAALLAVMSWV